MSLQLFQFIEQSIVPLGYELVDVELSSGIIRVFIDWPAQKQLRITIEDCEQVSRQLTQLMMVEDIDYKRLEVSSPGVDRRLRRTSDFERFVGHRISLRLRFPFGGRRHWEGELARAEGSAHDQWVLLLNETSASGKTAQRLRARDKAKARGKAATPVSDRQATPADGAAAAIGPMNVLNFTLDEVERAHLVPQLVF